MQSSLLEYIFNNLQLLKRRDFLIEIMTTCDRVSYNEIITYKGSMYEGKLLVKDNNFISVKSFTRLTEFEYQIDNFETTNITVPKKGTLTYPRDEMILPVGIIKNNKEELKTTFGRFILNFLVLSEPFGNLFPYINDKNWTTDRINKDIFNLSVQEKITSSQIDTYVKNLYFIGHLTEITVPNFTEKSLITDPRVAKRRKELLEKYKDELERGDPVIMSQIEQELIAMDKEWLKDDPSMNFYSKSPGKSFNVQRKKMLLTGGMIEEFGNEGVYNFMANPLSESVQKEDFVKVANEIRYASYSRAMETQDGGVLAKVLARTLQNARIIEEDCKTDKTMPLYLDPGISDFYKYRYVLVGGSLVSLEESELKKYEGKNVNLRSPMTCQTKGGYCSVCMGKIFSSLNQEALTSRAMQLSSFITLLSLKKSHGTSNEVYEIKTLDKHTF